MNRKSVSMFLSLLLGAMLILMTACSSNDSHNQAEANPDPTATVEITPTEQVIVGDAATGEILFTTGIGDAPACSTCHAIRNGQPGARFLSGPSLVGISTRAATRRPHLTAQEYLRQSILQPDVFLVDSYANVMYALYGQVFSDQDIADLVAYLLTL